MSVEDIPNWVGKPTGSSDWLTVSQDRIDQFADVTEDHQFIHVDPVRAKDTPFGGTVAHGFLTLSLLSRFAETGGMLVLKDIKMGVNYGFDKVRLMNPVAAGKRVRGHFKLIEATEKLPGQWAFKYAVKVEIEGDEKPALVAEWLNIMMVG
ncbi:MAG: MaoC family dehydratase [Pseudomonadota bacterium]